MENERDISWIETVKNSDSDGETIGYVVNGNMSVPLSNDNRHYKDILLWLESNTVEPMYTAEEIATNDINVKVAEAKQYLLSTDFKMTTDYDQDTKAVKKLRTSARKLIRLQEA
jgi:hypothetical protein